LPCAEVRALSSVEILNPLVGSWEAAAPMHHARRSAAVMATADGLVYAIGGCDGGMPLASVERYNIDINTWSEMPSLSTPRFGAAAAEFQGQIFVVGGHDGKQELRSCETLSSPKCWTEAAPLVAARFAPCASVLDGKLFVLGGTTVNQRPALSCERLDPEASSWTIEALPPQATPRIAAVNVLCPSLGLFSIGGFAPGDQCFENVARSECLALRTDEAQSRPQGRWTALAASRLPRLHPAAAAAEGKIYVLGGSLGGGKQASGHVERWDCFDNRWEDLPDMLTLRDAPAAVVVR